MDDLVGWVNSFLSSDDKVDVVKKFWNFNVKEKYVFILIIIGGVFWCVEFIFFSDMKVLNIFLKLLEFIIGVWIIFNGRGIRYMVG